jgi:hypothetical protein
MFPARYPRELIEINVRSAMQADCTPFGENNGTGSKRVESLHRVPSRCRRGNVV